MGGRNKDADINENMDFFYIKKRENIFLELVVRHFRVKLIGKAKYSSPRFLSLSLFY